MATGERDTPLFWIVLSIVALGGGLATALLPLVSRGGVVFYGWMLTRFLWSSAPLAILQAVTIFLIVLAPLFVLGVAFSGLHHIACIRTRWDVLMVTWSLLGAAAGAAIASRLTLVDGRGDLTLVAAALPALVVAVIAGLSVSTRAPAEAQAQGIDMPLLPAWTDKWSVVVRVGVVLVGGGIGYATSAWMRQIGENGMPAGDSLAPLLVAVGLGVAAGCYTRREAMRSIGGFGMACVVAGATLATASFVFRRGSATSTASDMIMASTTLFGLGFATAYGQQALLNRTANRSVAGATTLARMLIGASLLVWFGEPIAHSLAGSLLSFVLLVVCLLGLGGVLIIYEPGYSLLSRRLRLGTVFVCIGTLIVALGLPG